MLSTNQAILVARTFSYRALSVLEDEVSITRHSCILICISAEDAGGIEAVVQNGLYLLIDREIGAITLRKSASNSGELQPGIGKPEQGLEDRTHWTSCISQ